MSSHHIVKDQQEPALIIDEWTPYYNLILGDLLEWLPQIVCSEKALEKIITLGIKLDAVVISATDEPRWAEFFREQNPLEIIFNADKKHFLDVALQWLHERGHQSVNILTSMDRKREMIEHSGIYQHLNLIIYAEHHKVILHRNYIFKKWMTKNTFLIIFLPKESKITTFGFDDDYNEASLDGEIMLTTKNDGTATIKCSTVPWVITEIMESSNY